MSMINLNNLYQEAIKLSYKDQLNLISKLASSLQKSRQRNLHKLQDLQGLGKEIWQDIDTASYISDLREEWNER